MRIEIEDVSDYPEAKGTDFGFDGNVGVIRNDSDEIVGFCTINIDGPVIELSEIEIIDEQRGKGYGRQAVMELFRKYPECDIIEGKSLEDAVSFYAGFEDVTWSSTCEDCSVLDCCHNPKYEGNEDDLEADACDEYSNNIFQIRRVLI